MATARVLLVSMPLSSPHFPSIGLSLLKPALAKQGVDCRIRYFSLDYADAIGADAHDQLTDPRYYMAHVGEWVFAGALEERQAGDDFRYLHECFAECAPEEDMPARLVTFLSARNAAAAFIERCVGSVDWGDYAMVGFTTAFHQNMASLALARRVKEKWPGVFIAFGGTNCHGEMGIELHRRYPFIDAVCVSEGDVAFPELVRRRLAGADCAGIPGIVTREDSRTVVPDQLTAPVMDMESLPYPDFTDFFDQHRGSRVASKYYPPSAVFETSRGCWWGAKHHCTFCGLNAMTMAYRSKSQKRAYDELAFLASKYGRDFANADTILDQRYFQEFIPRLAAEGPRLTIYYEMKANLKPDQMTLLSRAGIVRIQPGLESLDSDILKLIDKGCTMLQNVQTLKLAAENGVYVEWLALYGLPGETAEQYRRIAGIIPKLRHLQPPAALVPVRADRFSPYFNRPESFGITLEPLPAYRFVYGFDEQGLRRIAYHFRMRSKALADADRYVAPAATAFKDWQDHKDWSALFCSDRGQAVHVVDRRWGRPKASWRLDGAAAEIVRRSATIAPWHALKDMTAHRFGADAVQAAMESLLDRDILLREGDNFLCLALRQPGYRRAPKWTEIRRGKTVPYCLRAPAVKQPAEARIDVTNQIGGAL